MQHLKSYNNFSQYRKIDISFPSKYTVYTILVYVWKRSEVSVALYMIKKK